MTEKKSKAAQVRDYQSANPKATPAEISKALDINISYVYLLRQQMKKQRKAMKPVAAPLKIVVSQDNQAETIKDLEASLEDAATIIRFHERRLFTNLYR